MCVGYVGSINNGIVITQHTIPSRMGYQQEMDIMNTNVHQILCKKLCVGCGVLVRVPYARTCGVHILILITDTLLLQNLFIR